MTGRWRRDAGVTLIELVVVIALFAMVALIGTQALRLMVRYQESLTRHAAAADDLAISLQVLRHDLGAATGLGGDQAPGAVSLNVAGVGDLDDPAQTGLARVVWRFDRANRRVTRSQNTPDAARPAMAQPMFAGVRDFDVLALSADGWAPASRTASDGVRGYDARLEMDTGPLRVLVVQ